MASVSWRDCRSTLTNYFNEINMQNNQSTRKYYWGRTIASFLLVLFTMPLGHALMIVMEKNLPHDVVHYAAFFMGLAGLVTVIVGVFAKGDTRQTLFGLIGGLLFWTGWVEFLFQYYAIRYGTQPEVVDGEVVTRPEYLILPATFGLWAMVMTLYLFSTKNGCNFINWCQRLFFGKRKNEIAARPMTRHASIVTFMELNMILWTSYLLLMFCYDSRFIGDQSPVTALVGFGCFVGSIFMFKKELRLASWGANIRMAIATVIVFWTPIEILGRLNFFREFWTEPEKYATQMITILVAFVALLAYIAFAAWKRNRLKEKEDAV